MAAVLACGDGALLSHRCAAALWGLLPIRGGRIHVTVDASGRSGRPGLAVHCARIRLEDRATRERIPVTSVARTLFDLAEVVDPGVLRRAFEAAERLRLLDLRAFDSLCEHRRGRHGLRPMLDLLPGLRPAPETRSELERRFLAFCRDARLPQPAVNVIVAGYEVDALWSDRRLVVELDSYEFHRTRAAFERDRARDAALQLAGYRVLRLTARRLEEEAEAAAEGIRSLLAG